MTAPSRNPLLSQIKATAAIWGEIKLSRNPADRWLASYFHHHRKLFGSRDRRFFYETIYAAYRHRTYLEAWAKRLGYENDDVITVLLAAVLENLISEHDVLSVAETVGKKITAKDLDPFYARALHFWEPFPSEAARLAFRYSFPLWIVEKWLSRFGAKETEALLRIANTRPPFTIRVNTLKITREKLLDRLCERYAVKPGKYSPTAIFFEERATLFDSEEFKEGLFEIQDEGSQLVGEKIDPQPTDLIWDVCAGGGGKSLQLGALMKNKGRIIATDIRDKKLEEVRKRAKRAGVHTIFPADLTRMADIRQLRSGADKILVDAPCSGTGTLRRNPDAKWKLKPEDLLSHQKNQLSILESAIPYLKKGGRLYYVTCSMEPEEGEQVMEQFLSAHSELSLLPSGQNGEPFFRLYPQRQGTDGFFLAIAEKIK